MRRDMELVRQILKDITEGNIKKKFYFRGPEKEENEKYVYHLEIMKQAGLIKYQEKRILSGGLIIHGKPTLTWIGNDF